MPIQLLLFFPKITYRDLHCQMSLEAIGSIHAVLASVSVRSHRVVLEGADGDAIGEHVCWVFDGDCRCLRFGEVTVYESSSISDMSVFVV